MAEESLLTLESRAITPAEARAAIAWARSLRGRSLTPTEYSLLQELAVNAGKVLTQPHLLRKVWDPRYNEEREYLRVFIGRLRAKLEPDPTNPKYIITVPGVGYKF